MEVSTQHIPVTGLDMTVRPLRCCIKVRIVRAICLLLVGGTSGLCAADEPAPPQPQSSQQSVLCGSSVKYYVEENKNLSDNFGLYLGTWTGIWNNSSKLCGALIVEKISEDKTADIIYIYADLKTGNPWKKQNQIGKLDTDGHLRFKDDDGGDFSFSIGERNTLVAQFTSRGGRLSTIFERKERSFGLPLP